MSAWNELHYSRAQEFARIVADLASGHAELPPAPVRPVPTAAEAPTRPVTAASRAPAAIPTPAPTPAPASATPTAKPTAASVFNKIPWKK